MLEAESCKSAADSGVYWGPQEYTVSLVGCRIRDGGTLPRPEPRLASWTAKITGTGMGMGMRKGAAPSVWRTH